MTPPIRILALCGSTRRASWNARLLQAFARVAEGDVSVRFAPSIRDLPLFSEDMEAESSVDARITGLIGHVQTCDALIVATPEYNQSLPGSLKNALDWLSRTSAIDAKPVAVIGCTVGPWGTRLAQAHLRHVLGVMGCRLVTSVPLYVGNVADCHDIVSNRFTASIEEKLHAIGCALAAEVRRARTSP